MSFPTEFHPEFGFLVPSPELRRVIRITVVAALIGAVFGGAGVFALTARPQDRGPAPAEPTFAIAQTVEVRPAGGGEARPTAGSEFAVASNRSPQPSVAAKPCNEQTWPYLDRKCLTGVVTRWRHVHVLPPDAGAKAAPVKSAEIDSRGINPSDPSATPTKKRKSGSRRSRGRDGDDLDGARDYASARDTREPRQDRLDGDAPRGQSRREARQERREARQERRARERDRERDRPDWRSDGGNWLLGR
jgi:hypothetical protein